MKKMIVTGLGAGDINQMPLGVYRLLKGPLPVFLRTREHPAVRDLEREGLRLSSFDGIYEKHPNFDDVYHEIAATLFEHAEKHGEIVYAVPGHPFVGEKTVQLLLEKSGERGVELVFYGGGSFLDSLFQTLRIDPLEGFQLLDATNLKREDIQVTQHVVIAQVYDFYIASEVKLTLMEILPDDYDVYLVSEAGGSGERLQKLKLYELDRNFQTGNLTSVYVPPVKDEKILYKQFDYLRRVVRTLRGPGGCPWDRKQTHESLIPHLREETEELIEAIREKDEGHMVEELGDVLLQVMHHSQIGEEQGYFTVDDVIEQLVKKLIFRHPHVFSGREAKSVEDVKKIWKEMKEKEKDL
ncbi:putative tetrapyrrole methyltransferase domain [Caldibacillus debilis]|uniref:Putative tetrapyrrole methyltransferase domain n=2 Tax=Caldibacillus debilis TaxID=301148 RepID=A0A150M2G8_9BACI|nr:putative tetrapyrrole methyltransferase domain [Caldibacillus debilis]